MDRHGVLLVEDERETRTHLARTIAAHPALELRGTAGDLAEARSMLERGAPEVLLTDLGLPDGSGITLIREAKSRHPGMLSMVITVFGDESSVISAIESGASGYLLKDGTGDEIADAILQLVSGGSPISAPIARHLLRRLRAEPPEIVAAPPRTDVPHLTGRETEVLRLIAKGFSYQEIAELLSISAHTVMTYVRRMYGKLEVGSRNAAVYEAVHLGLLQIDE